MRFYFLAVSRENRKSPQTLQKGLTMFFMILLSVLSFAQTDLDITLDPQVKMDSMGNLLLADASSGEMKTLTPQMARAVSQTLFERARDAACHLPIIPSSITASAFFISLTWQTKDLCRGVAARK